MKTTVFIALAAVFLSASLSQRAAAQGAPDIPKSQEPSRFYGPAHTNEAWSVIGQWHYAGPAWRGMIDIRADGTFSRAGDGQAGKWKLGGAEDNFVLILKWDHFPQDTVALVSPTLFHGDGTKGEITVRRLVVVTQVAPAAPPVQHFERSNPPGEEFAF